MLNFGNFNFAEEKDWRKNGGMQTKNDQRQSVPLFRSPIKMLGYQYTIGEVLCAGYILFCLIGAGNFYECCRGTETLSQGSPEARSQNITKDHKGKLRLFSQGMFHYSSFKVRGRIEVP